MDMPRRITTDTFLTITGPGINIRVCRALVDDTGKVAVWTRPHGAPQHVFQLPDLRRGLQVRGTLLALATADGGDEGTTLNYRRRGVSCSWLICKGKFNTRQVAGWWPADDATVPDPNAGGSVAVPAAVAVRRSRVKTVPRRRARPVAARQAPAPEAEAPAPVEEPAAEEPAAEEPAPANPITDDPTPLDDLAITPRLLTTLAAAEITTVGQLAAVPPDELAAISGVGPKALSEIADLIASRGE